MACAGPSPDSLRAGAWRSASAGRATRWTTRLPPISTACMRRLSGPPLRLAITPSQSKARMALRPDQCMWEKLESLPSRSARPAKHPQRAQGVPVAGPAFALVHAELEIAGAGVDHLAFVWVL